MAVKKKVFTLVLVVLLALFLLPSRVFPDDIDGILADMSNWYSKWLSTNRKELKTEINVKLKEFKKTWLMLEYPDKPTQDLEGMIEKIIYNKSAEKMVEFKKFLADIEKMVYPTKSTKSMNL